MDAVQYFKERKRMIKHTAGGEGSCYDANCSLCPLSRNNNSKDKYCRVLENDFPEEAIAIVEKWSEENPQRTMLQDFLEKFPNAPLEGDGTPKGCPSYLGYCEDKECYLSCKECWNRPLE